MESPCVSVLMSVYNEDSELLRESVESILSQTFSDFEFIIIGDGPDNLRVNDLIKYYQIRDNRIKFYLNIHNIGLTRSLNVGLSYCKGNYIARMDADDISAPDRIEKQVAFLNQHEDVNIVHSNISIFGDNINDEIRKSPFDNKTILKTLMHSNCINHPAVMFRRSVFAKLGLTYNELFRRSQDYELWLHAAMLGCKFATIPEVLLKYRVSDSQITKKHRDEQLADQNAIKCSFFDSFCKKNGLVYPTIITRNYIESFVIANKKDSNNNIMFRTLKFQLYYTLRRTLGKFFRIIPDSIHYGFSIKQTTILFLSFFVRDRWSVFDMNYLIRK